MKILSVAAAMAALAISVSAHAADKPELRIGSVVAMTGPASALGLPEKNALELLQEQLANDTSLPFTVKFITYDDVELPPGRLCDRLYAEQLAAFPLGDT